MNDTLLLVTIQPKNTNIEEFSTFLFRTNICFVLRTGSDENTYKASVIFHIYMCIQKFNMLKFSKRLLQREHL